MLSALFPHPFPCPFQLLPSVAITPATMHIRYQSPKMMRSNNLRASKGRGAQARGLQGERGAGNFRQRSEAALAATDAGALARPKIRGQHRNPALSAGGDHAAARSLSPSWQCGPSRAALGGAISPSAVHGFSSKRNRLRLYPG